MGKIHSMFNWIVRFFVRRPLVKEINVFNSNSQAGEDRILNFLFETMGIQNITYIDIGANHPIISNNTYLFYKKGCKGVVIEPDPTHYENLKKERPDDLVVQAAINDKVSGDIDFYLFNNSQLNTLSKEEATFREESGSFKIVNVIKIKTLTIEEIIILYLNDNVPELVSLDVEGVDYEIIKSFNFLKYPIPIWIIETCGYSENHIKQKITNIADFMKSKGYFVYADTYINTIFVNTSWFYEHRK